ncbi:GntR family transcriptional regulator [Elioraea sp.]|uniref:GntR family transcriptional regulator n=1 Tax=Elioraea sp. TaxID=2185103 RepID=UPI003F71BD6B
MINSSEIDQISGTIEDRVLDALRRLIVTGTFQPGAKLTVAAIATRLGVSPMPVRAALRQLAGEGLIEADANRGARVRVLSADDIRNLYRLRGAVLGLLIPDVVRHVSEADLDALEAIEGRFEAAVARGDGAIAMAANHDFHAALLALARNRDAAAVMERTWALVEALRLRLGFGPGRLDRAVEGHRALLAALRRRDAATATALAVTSSDNAMADLLARAEATPLRARSARPSIPRIPGSRRSTP